MYLWDIENKKGYSNKMGRYKTKYETSFIDKYVKNPMRILDIGGGSGRFAIPLYEKGHDILVIDRSTAAADALSKRCSGLKVIVDDFDNVVFAESERFDLIMMMEVLVYFEDWSRIFERVYNLLKDDGVVIFTAPNKHSWRSLLKQIFGNEGDFTVLSLGEYYGILKHSYYIIDRVEGFLWIPCTVDSNSIFVSIFAFVERALCLNRVVSQSPWLLFAAKKDVMARQMGGPRRHNG